MNLTEKLADFVVNLRYEDIPMSVIETQKKSVLDALGITYGASGLGDGCAELLDTAIEGAADGKPEATVIGGAVRLPAVWAAFANAAMAHSLDFGDTQMHAVVHSNASTFPAALAAAEKRGNVSGKEFLTALVAGSETACRIALGVHSDLEGRGFYMPPIYTSFGATAAVGRLMGLGRQELVDAFSLNLCQTTCSAELMNNADTWVRSVREAFAAKNALLSCMMASRGVKGFADPLQGKYGFYQAYAGQAGDEEAVLEGLGSHFEAGELYFKLWPSCAGTHPVIRLLRELSEQEALDWREIKEVHVTTSVRNRMLMEPLEVRRRPDTSIVAKFSIPYTGALALISGTVTLGDFSPERLRDADVLSLADRFTYEVREDWGKEDGMNTDVCVHMKNGRCLVRKYRERGQLQNEPSWKEMEEKYLATASYAARPQGAEKYRSIAEEVRRLEHMDNMVKWAREL
ncbi:MAG: MmgE/PrpD family protein [Lachnospiraceae bacterium]|nr:MmgE/PrpD family protein [Lachnospiraceae bacterium]